MNIITVSVNHSTTDKCIANALAGTKCINIISVQDEAHTLHIRGDTGFWCTLGCGSVDYMH